MDSVTKDSPGPGTYDPISTSKTLFRSSTAAADVMFSATISTSLGDRPIPSLEFKSPAKVTKPFGSAMPRFRYPETEANRKASNDPEGDDGTAEQWKPDGTYSQVHDTFIVKKKALKDTIDLIKEMDARRQNSVFKSRVDRFQEAAKSQ